VKKDGVPWKSFRIILSTKIRYFEGDRMSVLGIRAGSPEGSEEYIASQWRHRLAEKVKTIELLRKALKKYGLHKEGCDIECHHGEPIDSDNCTCGLSKAIQGVNK
jgi:hypothetical protein